MGKERLQATGGSRDAVLRRLHRGATAALTFAVFVPPIVLALVTAVVASGEPKRFARKHVVSKVAPALRALDPSPLEMSRVLADLRAQGFAVAQFIAAADVMRALEKA